MAETKLEHVFDPDVWAALVQAEFTGQIRFAPYAFTSDTLVGTPGSEVDFPKWDALSDLDKLTEAVPMVPEVMGQTTSKARIAEYGKAVEITDTARLSGLGDPEAEAVRQFGVLAARKIDEMAIAASIETTDADPDNRVRATAPYEITLDTPLDWNGIVDGTAAFGDEWDPTGMSAIFIRSDARTALWKSDDFTKAADLGAATALTTGQVGIIAGVPVIVTDRLPEGQALIVRPNAVGILWKRRPLVEYDRDILKRTDVIATNVHFAAKRINDKGVAVINYATGGTVDRKSVV